MIYNNEVGCDILRFSKIYISNSLHLVFKIYIIRIIWGFKNNSVTEIFILMNICTNQLVPLCNISGERKRTVQTFRMQKFNQTMFCDIFINAISGIWKVHHGGTESYSMS